MLSSTQLKNVFYQKWNRISPGGHLYHSEEQPCPPPRALSELKQIKSEFQPLVSLQSPLNAQPGVALTTTKLDIEPEVALTTTKLNTHHEVTQTTTKPNTQPEIELTTTTLNPLPEVAQTTTKYYTPHDLMERIEIGENINKRSAYEARTMPYL